MEHTLSVTSLVVAAVVVMVLCNVHAVSDHFIIVSEVRRIRGLELNESARFTYDVVDPIVSSKAIAVDYDARTENIYWTDYSEKAIMRTKFNSTVTAVVYRGLATPDGMAIDWIGNHIYYTDSTLIVVGMISMDGYYGLPLVSSQLSQPRAIALDPSNGMMYWTDWGNAPKIERSYMSGQKRELLVNTSLIYPNGLTLDLSGNVMYWVDARLDRLERSRLDGSGRKVLVRYNTGASIHPFALTLYGSYLYWTDWRLMGVVRVSLETLNTERIVATLSSFDKPMGIAVYDAQRRTGGNGCSSNNGGCQQICLAEGIGKRCDCSYGTLNTDGNTCRVSDSYVLYSDIDSVRATTFTPHDDREATYAVETTEIPFGVDYAADLGIVFWTEQEAQRIMRTPHRQGTQPVVVVDSHLSKPVSVAYDWMAGNLFFSDMGKGSISVCRRDGRFRRDVIITDLGEPTSLAVDPGAGYMYWTDAKTKFNRIERSHMNGESREVVIPSDVLNAPRGLTLDLTARKIYWVEHHANKIGVADLDGSNRLTLISHHHLLDQPLRLAHYNGYLYVSSRGTNNILRCEDDGSNLTLFRRTRDTPDGIAVVHPGMQLGGNSCSRNNGGCPQLCLAVPGGRVCACTMNNTSDCVPAVLSVQSTEQVLLGRSARLHCNVQDKGVPVTSITWLHDGIVVSKFHKATGDIEFELGAVTLSDSGRYTCVIENEYGSVTSDPHQIIVVSQVTISSPVDSSGNTLSVVTSSSLPVSSDNSLVMVISAAAGGFVVLVILTLVIGTFFWRRYRKSIPRVVVMNPTFNVTTGSYNRRDESPPPYQKHDPVNSTAAFVEEVLGKSAGDFV